MDSQDLKSASKYVNNLLASRGLLRGLPIPFHRPNNDDGSAAKIINLVHELITRRDREAEQRENLALTIRALRTAEEKQSTTIERLQSKTADLERKNSIQEAQARSFNATLRTAESASKALKDDANRLKTLLSQVRTQCANDIRKRDLQIQRMKDRLNDTRRGNRPPMSLIHVTGGNGVSSSSSLSSSRGIGHNEPTDDEHAAASLAQDTTEFLATLSQTLADENDNLIALIRQCLSTLKAVQGLPDDETLHVPQSDLEAEERINPLTALPASYESLSEEMESVMYTLKELLNQPNYVPIEELAERDDEIRRLNNKVATIEEEWKKALDLVDGWNKTLGKASADSAKALLEKANSFAAGGGGNGERRRTLVNEKDKHPRDDDEYDGSNDEPQENNIQPAEAEEVEVDQENNTPPAEAEVEVEVQMQDEPEEPVEQPQPSPSPAQEEKEKEQPEAHEPIAVPEPKKRRRSSRNKPKLPLNSPSPLKPPPSSAVQRKKRKSTRRKVSFAADNGSMALDEEVMT